MTLSFWLTQFAQATFLGGRLGIRINLSGILFYCIGISQRTFERGWYPSTLNIFVTLAVQDLMDWEDLPIPPDLYQRIFMSAPGPFTRSYCCHP